MIELTHAAPAAEKDWKQSPSELEPPVLADHTAAVMALGVDLKAAGRRLARAAVGGNGARP